MITKSATNLKEPYWADLFDIKQAMTKLDSVGVTNLAHLRKVRAGSKRYSLKKWNLNVGHNTAAVYSLPRCDDFWLDSQGILGDTEHPIISCKTD